MPAPAATFLLLQTSSALNRDRISGWHDLARLSWAIKIFLRWKLMMLLLTAISTSPSVSKFGHLA
jgi:hypothetical protein